VLNPTDQELERLRSILRDAHNPREPLVKKVMRALKTRLGARMQKKALSERSEKPKKEDAA
jgi:hypothetical protein